jgi:hypothetical protein
MGGGCRRWGPAPRRRAGAPLARPLCEGPAQQLQRRPGEPGQHMPAHATHAPPPKQPPPPPCALPLPQPGPSPQGTAPPGGVRCAGGPPSPAAPAPTKHGCMALLHCSAAAAGRGGCAVQAAALPRPGPVHAGHAQVHQLDLQARGGVGWGGVGGGAGSLRKEGVAGGWAHRGGRRGRQCTSGRARPYRGRRVRATECSGPAGLGLADPPPAPPRGALDPQAPHLGLAALTRVVLRRLGQQDVLRLEVPAARGGRGAAGSWPSSQAACVAGAATGPDWLAAGWLLRTAGPALLPPPHTHTRTCA